MLTIYPSTQTPRTQIKQVRRSWDDRLFSLSPFQPYEIKKVPFVLKIGTGIFVHPDHVASVERFLQAHNLAYKCDDRSFEPPKNQASMWELA